MASPVNDYSGSPRPIYRYRNLPLQSIRLLHLKPGSFDDDIAIWLESVSFRLEEESDEREPPSNQRPEPSQSPGSPIEYEALSYVWGPKENPMVISIEDEMGCIAHVTRNLYIALKHLRYEERVRVLWIDALCVDQANHEEKSAQVAIMADIYQHAHRVVAWLGPDADDSNFAMLSMQHLGSRLVVNWPETSDSSLPQYSISAAQGLGPDGFEWIRGNVPIPIQTPERDAIFKLLSRPWSKRLWIRQEIFLANRDAVILCGKQQILWLDIRRAMFALYSRRLGHKKELSLLMDRLSGFMHTYPGSGYRLSRLLFCFAACEDPRDRIYATLRLLYEERNVLGITPDYNKTVGQVYADATWRIIKRERGLTVLGQCELYPTLPGPSWAPDWSRRPMFEINYSSRASSCLRMNLTESDGRVLRVVGKLITVIDHLENITNLDFASQWSKRAHTIGNIVRTVLARTTLSSDQVLESCATMLLGFYNSDNHESALDPHYPGLRHMKSMITQALAGCSFQEVKDSLGPHITGVLHSMKTETAGRLLFIGSNNLFGMTTIFAQPGDHIYVLVGCGVPIALRPVEGNQYLVVGACWADSIMHGEALLGPLPENVRPVWHKYMYQFENIDSGEVVREDPRLVNLGVDLQGFREELEQDPDDGVTLNVDVNILHRAGVTDLQTIELA